MIWPVYYSRSILYLLMDFSMIVSLINFI